MKLIVGLGNPGRKYQGTRHNVGFRVLAELAHQYGTSRPRVNFQGETVQANIDGASALLLCPHTYMNNSGASIQPARDFFKLSNEDLLVVCDDFNLPLAKLRFRARGSAGGQKGLADIVRRLGTEEFSRLRIGVGPLPDAWDAADFVLSKFAKHELPETEQAIALAAEAVADWTGQGIQYCMNQYNAD